MKHTYLCILCMLYIITIFAPSMVYNFRVAQITKQPLETAPTPYNRIFVSLLFDQFRKKRTGTFQNFGGGLVSFIYDLNTCYCRIDGAVANIYEKRNHEITFSGTETDDLLFTAGKSFILDNRKIITLSGLFGVPTHKINRLEHVDFGYNQIGIGVQVDGSYELTDKSTLLYGGRYIYFVPRNAKDMLDQNYRISIGNVGDLLLAYKNNWNKKNGIEFGYTLRSRFGAHIKPNRDDFIERVNYLRSNFYGVYKYKFSLHDHPNRLLWYVAYGFDHKPKHLGFKYIMTFWTSWSIGF